MVEQIIDNNQKQANYTEQFRRLSKALANDFNLEAMFIAYAIMEDRTESILRHGSHWDAYLKKRKGKDPTISTKISYIQGKANADDKLLRKYFSDDLLDRILIWKDARNRLIHALLQQQLEHNEVRKIATEGDALVRALRSRANNYNRAIVKAKEVK